MEHRLVSLVEPLERFGGQGERDESGPSEEGGSSFGPELISTVLCYLHMDTQCLLEQVMRNYNLIYGCRKEGRGFRKCEKKARVAAAFAIANTLARERIPRPTSFISRLCGLEREGSLLDLPAALKMRDEELQALSPEDYELHHSPPSEFVDVVCAHLGIPFHISSAVREQTEKVEWAMYDRSPTTIVAAMIQKILTERRGRMCPVLAARLCQQLECAQSSVDSALEDLRKLMPAYSPIDE